MVADTLQDRRRIHDDFKGMMQYERGWQIQAQQKENPGLLQWREADLEAQRMSSWARKIQTNPKCNSVIVPSQAVILSALSSILQ